MSLFTRAVKRASVQDTRPERRTERGISPLYSCGRIHIRARCAAALTIVLPKLTLPDRPNFQPLSFRMKWQMLSAPSSQGLRFQGVVITSEVPFPTRRYGCARWDASEGSAFGDHIPRVVSVSQLGQKLRANVPTKIARIEATKFPVMNTCTKKGGGTPSFFRLLPAPPVRGFSFVVALPGAR
jgi:hypothetical protein